MNQGQIPHSLFELAELTRPDKLEVNDSYQLLKRIQDCRHYLMDLRDDEQFWRQVTRDGMPVELGNVLPHAVNGDHGLAALVQSRAAIPTDGALRARKTIEAMLHSIEVLLQGAGWHDQTMFGSVLIQVLSDLFTAAAGMLVMVSALINEDQSMAIRSGFIDAGVKTIFIAGKDLKAHIAPVVQVIY